MANIKIQLSAFGPLPYNKNISFPYSQIHNTYIVNLKNKNIRQRKHNYKIIQLFSKNYDCQYFQ